MVDNDFRKKYKVNLENNENYKNNQIENENKSNVEIEYEKQVALKNIYKYVKKTDDTFLQILNIFNKKYKGVGIDCPIGRTKSNKSLRGKLEKLEIERLCTIYEIDSLKREEKESLEKLIIGKVEKTLLHKKIKKIINEKVEDLKLIDSLMKEKDLNDNVKMALLRITRTKLEKEEKDEAKKEQYINSLEYNYGEEAAKRTKKLANNIMHWENIESVKNAKERIDAKEELPEDREIIEKLYDSEKYLKIKDLRGFRIIITNVSDEVETDNEFLKGAIERRKKAPEADAIRYNDLSCIEVEKDFASFLEQNQEMLRKMNLKLIARKEKSKQNGYIADHLKFCYLDNEDYSFELQIRSLYRDDMARGNGPAGHQNRPGKGRKPLNLENAKIFNAQVDNEVPKYTIYPKNRNGVYDTARKCKRIENVLAFYPDLDVNSKDFKKMIEYVNEYGNEK